MVSGVFAKSLAAGDHYTCVLLNEGGVICFGMNEYGQLGTGKFISMTMPIAVGKGEIEVSGNDMLISLTV